jgi:hypothetical protein
MYEIISYIRPLTHTRRQRYTVAKKKKPDVDRNRPTDFFVQYYDAAKYQAKLDRLPDYMELVDPADIYVSLDAIDLPTAIRKARHIARTYGTTVGIYRRMNIYREPSEWPGTDWWSWKSIDRVADVEPDGTYTRLHSPG